MVEHVFTIFDGPDEGKVFILSDKPITVGRQDGCDAVLHDDRVSRRHCRLLPSGERVVVVDENSANGTFVNGLLVQESVLQKGDVLDLGASRIVYGRESPSAERMNEIAAQTQRTRHARNVASKTTALLGSGPELPTLCLTETRVGDILEAVADAAQSVAGPRGIHVSVQVGAECGIVAVDKARLYRGLAGLLAALLEVLPTARQGLGHPPAPATLLLKAEVSPSPNVFRIEIICSGLPIPRERIMALAHGRICAVAGRTAAAHGGDFQLLPTDSPPNTLARMRLPPGSSAAPMPTTIAAQ